MRKIAIDKAEVDAAKTVEDSDDYLVVPAVIALEGVFPYAEGQAFKPADELKEAAWTADAAWIVAEKHPDTLILTDRADIRGKVENASFCSDIKGIKADLRFFKKLTDPQFIADIKDGKRKDVSIGFFYDFDATPGNFNGQHYDFVQRQILINHVAAGVPAGRCRSPYCGIAVDALIRKAAVDAFNREFSVDPEETEEYIHVPVRDAGSFIEDSFRTIDIDGDKGVKAVIGKLKSDPDGSTHVQKYLFAKVKDWTLEKAEAWVEEHTKTSDTAGKALEGIKEKTAAKEAESKPETDAQTEIARTKRLLHEVS